MNRKHRRLFVIIDPYSEHQEALNKALSMARLGDCHIHAFACVYRELDQENKSSSRKDLKHKTLKQAQTMIDGLLEPCQNAKISCSSEVVWNERWYDRALHSIAKSGCELVIKSSFHHSRARRFFSKTSDYSLMHYCASPVLFVHQGREWNTNKMLVCVALELADLKHRRLNNVIIRNAIVLKEMSGMNLSVVSTYQQELDRASLPVNQHSSDSLEGELAKLYGIERDNMILRQGATVESIKQVCSEVEPSIVVIGSIAQGGITGKLIGSTAEKLLDTIESDLLVVS